MIKLNTVQVWVTDQDKAVDFWTNTMGFEILEHCQRLAEYCTAIGQRIGANEDEMTALRRGGILHDIGKVAVPEQILCKNGPLTTEERVAVNQQHVGMEATLAAGDEVAFFPPVTGG